MEFSEHFHKLISSVDLLIRTQGRQMRGAFVLILEMRALRRSEVK